MKINSFKRNKNPKIKEDNLARLEVKALMTATEIQTILDDSSMYEKKFNILHIPHIFLWKMINEKQVKLEDQNLVG